jgi:hypothetical protein
MVIANLISMGLSHFEYDDSKVEGGCRRQERNKVSFTLEVLLCVMQMTILD